MFLRGPATVLLVTAIGGPLHAQSAAVSPPPFAVVPVEDNVLGIPPAVYPKLPSRFRTAQEASPPTWRIEHRVNGDLDRDGRSDVVLILRQDAPTNRVDNPYLGSNPFDTNPRILAIGIADDDGFRLVVQNVAFIPRNVTPTMEDPLVDAPTIQDGVLSIQLSLFLSAGGWTTWNTESRFRLQDGVVRLIGQKYVQVRRNTGEMIVRSANLLTRRIETTETFIDAEEDRSPRIVTRSSYRTPPTLDEIGNGLEFDPTGAGG